MLKCYDVKSSTIGFVDDEKKMEFETEEAYVEYVREKERKAEDEFHARANRLAEPPAYIKGVDY